MRFLSVAGADSIRRAHAVQPVGAAGVALTASDLQAIESALKAIEVVGDRYPAHLQKNVNR
jgi:hypothetical protein